MPNASFTDWSVTDYIFDVVTSDRNGADTDSNVGVQLFGQGGTSEPFQLPCRATGRPKAFERNRSDQFIFLNCISYGLLHSIKVWHDSSGIKPQWHLASVEVSDIKRGMTFRFPCHRWLAKDMDDGKVCRELRCSERFEGPKTTFQVADGEPKEKRMQPNDEARDK